MLPCATRTGFLIEHEILAHGRESALRQVPCRGQSRLTGANDHDFRSETRADGHGWECGGPDANVAANADANVEANTDANAVTNDKPLDHSTWRGAFA